MSSLWANARSHFLYCCPPKRYDVLGTLILSKQSVSSYHVDYMHQAVPGSANGKNVWDEEKIYRPYRVELLDDTVQSWLYILHR